MSLKNIIQLLLLVLFTNTLYAQENTNERVLQSPIAQKIDNLELLSSFFENNSKKMIEVQDFLTFFINLDNSKQLEVIDLMHSILDADNFKKIISTDKKEKGDLSLDSHNVIFYGSDKARLLNLLILSNFAQKIGTPVDELKRNFKKVFNLEDYLVSFAQPREVLKDEFYKSRIKIFGESRAKNQIVSEIKPPEEKPLKVSKPRSAIKLKVNNHVSPVTLRHKINGKIAFLKQEIDSNIIDHSCLPSKKINAEPKETSGTIHLDKINDLIKSSKIQTGNTRKVMVFIKGKNFKKTDSLKVTLPNGVVENITIANESEFEEYFEFGSLDSFNFDKFNLQYRVTSINNSPTIEFNFLLTEQVDVNSVVKENLILNYPDISLLNQSTEDDTIVENNFYHAGVYQKKIQSFVGSDVELCANNAYSRKIRSKTKICIWNKTGYVSDPEGRSSKEIFYSLNKTLRDEGYVVSEEYGSKLPFDLKNCDQLWIPSFISGGTFHADDISKVSKFHAQGNGVMAWAENTNGEDEPYLNNLIHALSGDRHFAQDYGYRGNDIITKINHYDSNGKLINPILYGLTSVGEGDSLSAINLKLNYGERWLPILRGQNDSSQILAAANENKCKSRLYFDGGWTKGWLDRIHRFKNEKYLRNVACWLTHHELKSEIYLNR